MLKRTTKIDMNEKEYTDRKIRKSIEKNINKNIKFHNIKSHGFEINEMIQRVNNYKYLKTKQKICGVKKNRLNSLLCIGCPQGRNCRYCSDKKIDGKKKEDRNVCKKIIKNIDEYIFDTTEPEINISNNENLKLKNIYFNDLF